MNKTLAFLLFFALSLPLHSHQLMKSVTWENIKAHPAGLPLIGEVEPVASRLDAPSIWSVGTARYECFYAGFEAGWWNLCQCGYGL